MYVDDTLLLIKPNDIPTVLSKFNAFDKNLQFTVDTFADGVIHFLDIKILLMERMFILKILTLDNTHISLVSNIFHAKLHGLNLYFIARIKYAALRSY